MWKDGKQYTLVDGQYVEVSPNNPMSVTSTGVQKDGVGARPNLGDIALSQGQDIALKQGQNAIVNAVTGPSETASVANDITQTANAGSQAAWNSGASAATKAANPGAFSISNIGSSGNAILPAAGLAGAYDLWANRPENVGHGSGYLEGAASGAAIGSYFGPTGAVVGAGAGLLANAFGIGHQSATKLEEDHRASLAAQGVVVPNSDVKEWELNPDFAKSRDESTLKGKDIIHAAQLYDIQGYAGADEAKQEAIANKALEDKLIREEHGQIDVGHNADFDSFVQSQLSAPAPTGVPRYTPSRQSQQVVQGPSREQVAEVKKQKKKVALQAILDTPTEIAPNYEVNPSPLMKNPYL